MRLDLLGPLLEELKIGKPYNLFRESGPDKSKRAWYITLRLVFTFALTFASLQFEQESLFRAQLHIVELELVEATLESEEGFRRLSADTRRTTAV